MQSAALCWLSLIIAAVNAVTYQFPKLTGSYNVGTTSAELVDYTRVDYLAPTPRPRALVVSFFYPITNQTVESGDYEIAPAFDATTAASFDQNLNLTQGTAEALITRSYLDAPLASDDFPVLLFSHGFGATRLLHIAQLEDLASHGWFIVDIDITYDAIAVEFPDGSVAYEKYPESDDYPGQTTGLVELRDKDVEFVRSALENVTNLERIPSIQVDGRPPKLKLDQVGSFGHSLGGATSALTLLNSPYFVCGANFDGPIYGDVLNTSISKPFVQIARSGHNQTNDESWAALWRDLKGFRRQYEVRGTVHRSFQDFTIYRDLFGNNFPDGQGDVYGTIGGERLIHIETALMDALFGFCLKGKPSQDLDHVLEIYPEVFVNL